MQTLLREMGGLEAYARNLMLSLSWREIGEAEAPERGDVGVVAMPHIGLTCAIYLGRGWMAKGAHLVLTLPAPHRAAWRVDGCHKRLPPSL